ncbi:MAG: secretin N-terminal domain-containing protein [Phycisphaerae bacterium]|nr:secretin N-terminal domain-containing protein [Phycisphaerae bacterium]
MSKSLKNIDPAAAKLLLDELKLATVVHIPDTPTLLITGSPVQLTKAAVVLNLIDRSGDFVITRLDQSVIPLEEDIKRSLPDTEIGSFDTPPINPELEKAILDTLDDGQMVLIADRKISEKILAAIESAKNSKPAGPNSIEPQDGQIQVNANKEGNDVIFGELVGAIEATEKMQEIKAKPQPMPENEEEKTEHSQDLGKDDELKAMLAKLDEQKAAETEKEIFEMELPAVPSYEPTAIPDATGELELDMPEQLQIADLLRLVGEYLHLDYMYDPAKVQGVVTLKLRRTKIKVNELYPLLESVLKFKGFVMTRRGNLVTIVPAAEAADIDPYLVDGGKGQIQVGDVIITKIFDLSYVTNDAVKTLLDQMKLGVSTTPIQGTGTLIVTAYTSRMANIEKMIGLIDKPGTPKKFRFRQLRYTLATNLVEQLKQLVEQLGNISIAIAEETTAPTPTSARRRRAASTPPTPAPAASQQQAVGPSVYLAADERTNRILMIGLDDELNVVEQLIDSLDIAQQDLRMIRVYDIQHVGAEDIIDKLNQLGIISTSKTDVYTPQQGRITRPQQRPGRPPQPDQPETASILGEEPLSEEPQVVIIESTNSLLVNATPEQHDKIALIIGYIDSAAEGKTVPYVVYPLENQDPTRLKEILDALISETIEEQSALTPDPQGKIVQTTKKTTTFGGEIISTVADPNSYSLVVYASKKNQLWISSLIKQLDEYRPQVLLDCTLVEITQNEKFEYDLDILAKTYDAATLQSTNIGGSLAPFANKDYGEARSTTSAADNIFKAFYDSKNIQGLLTAVQQKGYGRVMARPKILVNDNQEGEIKTQNTISVAQVKSTVSIPEQGAPVTSTDVTFNDYDAGVTLTIKPHISKGDMLRLEITLNRTDFTLKPDVTITDAQGTNTFPSPPDRLSTDVKTVGTVPDGTTIILGGLETLDQAKGHSKTPILGDLPLIGGLFRGVTDSGEQSRLYVFVKANIIRPGDQLAGLEDIKRVSERNRRAFEELEERFQEQEDWPGVKGKPMDPVRVLEIDD